MPVDNKKILWIALSVGIFVVVVFVVGFIFFYPKPGAGQAPATVANAAAPKTVSPEIFSSGTTPPPETPSAPETAPGSGETDIVVIEVPYGEKVDPSSIPSGSSGESSGSASASSQPSGTSPAASASGSSSAAPAASKPSSGASAPAAAAPSKPRTIIVTEWWIQTGSFTSKTRAEDLKKTLAAKGVSSVISTHEEDGTMYYRLRIGPYSTREEAEKWLASFKSGKIISDGYVTKTETTKTVK